MFVNKGKSLVEASALSGMDVKTARKYRRLDKLPSEVKRSHDWRTRQDPFEEIWKELEEMLEREPGLQAKTLFEYVQENNPGKFQDGQIRTLQRRIKCWKAAYGSSKEVSFTQVHHPGHLSESDFTHVNGITINGVEHPHLLYHFVLTYSNWEAFSLCYSESFESLSEGLQSALWRLGGVPLSHRTDRLSAAVRQDWSDEESPFTRRYNELLNHYGLKGEKIQTGCPNENGDVEQSHFRLKDRIDQALMLRGSRDFACIEEYCQFVQKLIDRANKGRCERFEEERKVLGSLPAARLESFKRLKLKVGPSSTIHVAHNTYSVSSRLIGEMIEVRLHANYLEVWYGQKRMEDHIPRLRGEGRHAINYRHVIDSLVRKPGAFLNYRYREDLYPTTWFRMAWDELCASGRTRPEKDYLKILELAARESESRVELAIQSLWDKQEPICFKSIDLLVSSDQSESMSRDVHIDEVDLGQYDSLVNIEEVV